MWRGALLLPLLLLCEVLATTNDQIGVPSVTMTETSSSAATVGATRDVLYSPVSLFWRSLGTFLSNHLPGDISSADPSFFNDLRLAFNLSHPNNAIKVDYADESSHLEKPEKRSYLHSQRRSPHKSGRGDLLSRDQQVLDTKTKCRVKSTLPHQEWDGDIPNYTPTDSNGRPLPTQTIGDGHGGYGQEIISVTSLCGNIRPGATVNTNSSTGPNGQFAWLTCGIDPNNNSTGWQPPFATVDQIITYPGGLRAAVQADGSPYKPCAKFVELFETAGAEFQVPPLYIAAFALQESGCNPDTDGGGGEQGMMQISPEKCADAPNGDCKDVVYNVRTAVSYFRDVLRSVNNNTFEAVGNYNGWFRGMNYSTATSWGVNGDCCRCQRNLSYLTQFFNGWLQNIDAWNPWLGSIHNTDVCSD